MIRALIFDFFDVFRTDAYKAWLNANRIPHEGEYFDASRQQDLGNITNQEFLARLSRLSGREITRQELDSNAKVDHDVVKLAAALRHHYKIALLSNSPSAVIRGILADHDLERHFDEIVVSSEVGLVKPSAEIFHLVLERLQVQASEALFIDDNPGHVKAAGQVGIHGLQFQSAAQLKQDLIKLGITAL